MYLSKMGFKFGLIITNAVRDRCVESQFDEHQIFHFSKVKCQICLLSEFFSTISAESVSR